MTSMTMGEGERREAACRRRARMRIAGSVIVAAALIGTALIGKRAGGTMDPAWSVVAALLYLGSLAYFIRLGIRGSDEYEMRATVRALATGMIVFALAFPVWMFLGDGGLLPEPNAQRLFTLSFLSVMLSYFWHRSR